MARLVLMFWRAFLFPVPMSTLNRQWHAEHQMPPNASPEQRIAWHVEHAQACDCRPIPPGVLALMGGDGAAARRRPGKRGQSPSRGQSPPRGQSKPASGTAPPARPRAAPPASRPALWQETFAPNLTHIALEDFKSTLATGRLLPSRKPLLEDVNARFALLEKAGLRTLGAVQQALATPGKLAALAARTGLPPSYLKLLRREVLSSVPKPIRFSDVPGLLPSTLAALEAQGCVDTARLFPHVRTAAARAEFARVTKLPAAEVLRLAQLVDVSRIKWVGPKLAALLVATEYNTVDKLAKALPVRLLKALNEAKANDSSYRGALGIADIESWVRLVVDRTPRAIEF